MQDHDSAPDAVVPADGPAPTFVYKVCPRREWEAAMDQGAYLGSADDQRDGFVHFSTRDQLAGTLQKHFSGQLDLVLVEVRTERLGSCLKMEPSRAGQLFPHLYGQLDPALAERQWSLPPELELPAELQEPT